jgi:hypothetical protein
MANIYIGDIATTELQELNLLTNSENDLKDLSNVEQNNVQGGTAVNEQSNILDLTRRCKLIPYGVAFPNGISGGSRPMIVCF